MSMSSKIQRNHYDIKCSSDPLNDLSEMDQQADIQTGNVICTTISQQNRSKFNF